MAENTTGIVDAKKKRRHRRSNDRTRALLHEVCSASITPSSILSNGQTAAMFALDYVKQFTKYEHPIKVPQKCQKAGKKKTATKKLKVEKSVHAEDDEDDDTTTITE